MAGLEQSNLQGDQIVNEKSAYATKKFRLEGVTIYSDEFPADEKTQSRSSCSSSESLSSSNSSSEPNLDSEKKTPTSVILCGKLSGRHEIAMRYKQSENLPGPKVRFLSFSSARFLTSFFIRWNSMSLWDQPCSFCPLVSSIHSVLFFKLYCYQQLKSSNVFTCVMPFGLEKLS